MREEAPCPTWAKTGTPCDDCQKRGIGACQRVQLKRQVAIMELEEKLARIERGEHQIFTMQEVRLLLESWRVNHPKPLVVVQ